jgi:endoglucanase Acf2
VGFGDESGTVTNTDVCGEQHFHYGYFLYAVAVVAKFRPDFAEQHRAAVMSIARDIASPLAEEYASASCYIWCWRS